MQLITHLVELNNTFATDLFEFLEKVQVKEIFDRFNAIFDDLFGRYKKIQVDWRRFEEAHGNKEIREFCQLCNEKIENNRI